MYVYIFCFWWICVVCVWFICVYPRNWCLLSLCSFTFFEIGSLTEPGACWFARWMAIKICLPLSPRAGISDMSVWVVLRIRAQVIESAGTFFPLRQGLTHPKLALDSLRPTCFCLSRSVIKGVHHCLELWPSCLHWVTNMCHLSLTEGFVHTRQYSLNWATSLAFFFSVEIML